MLAVFWRALVAECLDPLFLRSVSRLGTPVHFIFLGLVVLNLVGGFQALGTLLSVGLMMLPAAAARFWTARVEPMCALALAIGFASCTAGLLLSYHYSCRPARRSSCRPASSIWPRSWPARAAHFAHASDITATAPHNPK